MPCNVTCNPDVQLSASDDNSGVPCTLLLHSAPPAGFERRRLDKLKDRGMHMLLELANVQQPSADTAEQLARLGWRTWI